MEKLLNFLDKYILKVLVSVLIVFIALYPKLPSIHINHTWVYIRLEDFLIAVVVSVWLIQLLRRKAKFPKILGIPIIAYWIFGFLSLVFSILVIGPTLINYFPSIAILSYLRRIEYMILFFVAFSSVKSLRDAKDYLAILILTTLGFSLYAVGQKFYLYIWNIFPSFFSKHPYCFPSYQTGNEEFAKGIPLCLPFDGRITSTFAGHYDLAAYLVLVIPIFLALIFTFRKRLHKVIFTLFTLLTIVILILTASRIAFPAYLLGSALTLTIIKKKKFILPLILISIVLLPIFSSSTARRFSQTFRVTSIVIDTEGNLVGEAVSDKLRDKQIVRNVPTQNLPSGSGYIGLPEEKKTDQALVRSNLTDAEAKRLQLESGGVELTAVTGNFTVKKALVYDISVTTRLQSEWPRAIRAFSKNVLLGSGFSTITLATDNDFLRFLGETGLLGLLSFLAIFLFLYILFRKTFKDLKDPLIVALGAGMVGGIFGLFLNAIMFDIFEASKVAETMWVLLGITAGLFVISRKQDVDYKEELRRVLLSSPFIVLYIFVIGIFVFSHSLGNFFVADDFTWLRWAATSSFKDLSAAFTDASGFFYRPIDKVVMFFLYALFAFKSQGYHSFMLVVHMLTAVGAYLLALRLFKDKLTSFLSAVIFLLLPIHSENLFWISTISTNLSSLFVVYGLWIFTLFREKKSLLAYILTIPLFALALFSYENSIVFIGLVALLDLAIYKQRINKKNILYYVPFVVLIIFYLYMRSASNALGFNGDYSYNVYHLIPNAVGNSLGYLATFVFGEAALPLYNSLRESLKNQILLSGGFILAALGVVLFIGARKKDELVTLAKDKNVSLLIFGLLFAFLALAPYLGLGNISPRYGYLPSVGFSISAGLFVMLLANFISQRTGKIRKEYIAIFLAILLGAFFVKELWHSNNEWVKAGSIAKRSLSYLKVYHEKLPNNSNLYFVNTPIRFEDAWVFPVGLPDAIWFIYRNETLSIKNVGSIEEARSLKAGSENKSYIFEFKDFLMEEVK